jgi:hypothetical protein
MGSMGEGGGGAWQSHTVAAMVAGNSRWHSRWWAFVATLVALCNWLAGWPGLVFCVQELSSEGGQDDFTIFAGIDSRLASHGQCSESVDVLGCLVAS